MARYRIRESGSAVAIEVTELAGRHEQLLGAFAGCQAGQCSCPTDEYRKLEAMDVEQGEEEIRLVLEPKPGEKFDLSEIAACLDHTTAQVAAEQSQK